MVHRAVNPKPHPAAVLEAPATTADSGKIDARLLRMAGVSMLGAVMTILDTTVVNVAQRTLIAEFGSTEAIVAWTMTAYTLALSTVIPLTGWAVDRFGARRLFIVSVTLFTVGSLLCAVADTILALIAFRVVQGLGGGTILPLAITIVTREAGPARLGRMSAVIGVPMLLGPICGPILGGWLIDLWGWPSIFLINIPIGVINVVLAIAILPKDHATHPPVFDLIGMVLLSPGLAIFLYGASSIPGRGTVADYHVVVPVVIGLALIGGFVVHALYRTDHPLIDLRLLADRAVSAANAAMLAFAAPWLGIALIVPSFFQQVLRMTPLQSGLHMIPQGLSAMITMAIAGPVVDRRGSRGVVLVGVTLLSAGLIVFAYGIWHRDAYLPILAIALAIIGLGMGCIVTPLTTAAVRTLPEPQIACGSTLINVNQRLAGSIGTALIAVVLTNQMNRSADIGVAAKLYELHSDSHAAVDPALIARAQSPGFLDTVATDLAHAYAVAFVIAAGVAVLTYLPALLLPGAQSTHPGALSEV